MIVGEIRGTRTGFLAGPGNDGAEDRSGAGRTLLTSRSAPCVVLQRLGTKTMDQDNCLVQVSVPDESVERE